jgi:hypothetical protein
MDGLRREPTMETKIERHRRVVANALELAATFPESADRRVLLHIATEHLRAIESEDYEPNLLDEDL